MSLFIYTIDSWHSALFTKMMSAFQNSRINESSCKSHVFYAAHIIIVNNERHTIQIDRHENIGLEVIISDMNVAFSFPIIIIYKSVTIETLWSIIVLLYYVPPICFLQNQNNQPHVNKIFIMESIMKNVLTF